jgi:hypothetical protein
MPAMPIDKTYMKPNRTYFDEKNIVFSKDDELPIFDIKEVFENPSKKRKYRSDFFESDYMEKEYKELPERVKKRVIAAKNIFKTNLSTGEIWTQMKDEARFSFSNPNVKNFMGEINTSELLEIFKPGANWGSLSEVKQETIYNLLDAIMRLGPNYTSGPLGQLDEYIEHNEMDEYFEFKNKKEERDIMMENPSDIKVPNIIEIMDLESNELEQRWSENIDASLDGKYRNRYFYSGMINLGSTEAEFGYRNRDEYEGGIKETSGIYVPLAEKLFPPDLLIGRKYGAGYRMTGNENSTVVGVDTSTNKILLGVLGDFLNNPNARLSLTTRNEVSEIPAEKGNVVGKLSRDEEKAELGYKSPVIITPEGKKGTLPLIFQEEGKDKMGYVQGGSLIFESQDKKKKILVSGSANQIAKAFELFKGEDAYVTIYNIDNGRYNLGFRNKNNALSEEELRKYDREHLTGGNGLYLKTK